MVLIWLGAAAPAWAYRIEFLVTLDGVRVPEAEVCLFQATSATNPWGHFLEGNALHCLPADDVIEIPQGRWNFFARHRSGFVGAGRSLLTHEGRPISAYKQVQIELARGGTLDFAKARAALRPGEWMAVYIESEETLSNVLPLEDGADRMFVPPGVRLVPLVVRDRHPVRVGDPLTVREGEQRAVVFGPPSANTSDVISWIRLDEAMLRAFEKTAALPPFRVTLTRGGRTLRTVEIAAGAEHADLRLLVFRSVPAGEVRLSLLGPLWEHAELDLQVAGNRGVVATDEPLSATPAAAVRIRAEGGPFAARILRCPGLAMQTSPSAVDIAACTEMQSTLGTESATFESLPAGVYLAEVLPVGQTAATRQVFYAAPAVEADVFIAPRL